MRIRVSAICWLHISSHLWWGGICDICKFRPARTGIKGVISALLLHLLLPSGIVQTRVLTRQVWEKERERQDRWRAVKRFQINRDSTTQPYFSWYIISFGNFFSTEYGLANLRSNHFTWAGGYPSSTQFPVRHDIGQAKKFLPIFSLINMWQFVLVNMVPVKSLPISRLGSQSALLFTLNWNE